MRMKDVVAVLAASWWVCPGYSWRRVRRGRRRVRRLCCGPIGRVIARAGYVLVDGSSPGRRSRPCSWASTSGVWEHQEGCHRQVCRCAYRVTRSQCDDMGFQAVAQRMTENPGRMRAYVKAHPVSCRGFGLGSRAVLGDRVIAVRVTGPFVILRPGVASAA